MFLSALQDTSDGQESYSLLSQDDLPLSHSCPTAWIQHAFCFGLIQILSFQRAAAVRIQVKPPQTIKNLFLYFMCWW